VKGFTLRESTRNRGVRKNALRGVEKRKERRDTNQGSRRVYLKGPGGGGREDGTIIRAAYKKSLKTLGKNGRGTYFVGKQKNGRRKGASMKKSQD